MIIIGLLIGGVLKGQQLITISKITSTISQVKGYQAAFHSFRDTYGGVSGDMANAEGRLAGCNAGNLNSCRNGTGNSLVGGPTTYWNLAPFGVGDENPQFWKHLALAGLITGVQQNAIAPAWGESHPGAAVGGGFTVIQSVTGGTVRFGEVESGDGLYLKLTGSITTLPSGAHSFGMGSEAVLPHMAVQMDRKMDDGRPWTGNVRATSWGVPANAAQGTCEYEYDERNDVKGCIMGFVVE
jgi:hypothetical protein